MICIPTRVLRLIRRYCMYMGVLYELIDMYVCVCMCMPKGEVWPPKGFLQRESAGLILGARPPGICIL